MKQSNNWVWFIGSTKTRDDNKKKVFCWKFSKPRKADKISLNVCQSSCYWGVYKRIFETYMPKEESHLHEKKENPLMKK